MRNAALERQNPPWCPQGFSWASPFTQNLPPPLSEGGSQEPQPAGAWPSGILVPTVPLKQAPPQPSLPVAPPPLQALYPWGRGWAPGLSCKLPGPELRDTGEGGHFHSGQGSMCTPSGGPCCYPVVSSHSSCRGLLSKGSGSASWASLTLRARARAPRSPAWPAAEPGGRAPEPQWP